MVCRFATANGEPASYYINILIIAASEKNWIQLRVQVRAQMCHWSFVQIKKTKNKGKNVVGLIAAKETFQNSETPKWSF